MRGVEQLRQQSYRVKLWSISLKINLFISHRTCLGMKCRGVRVCPSSWWEPSVEHTSGKSMKYLQSFAGKIIVYRVQIKNVMAIFVSVCVCVIS